MALRLFNRNIPQKPGVYFFKNKAGRILYIGKANNLRARLQSYRSHKSYKTEQLLKEASALLWEVLDSEIEALIREAELIKKYRSKYNILMRDDKQYLYVGFTKEQFPKIFVTHQPLTSPHPFFVRRGKKKDALKLVTSHYKLATNYIGPFTDAGALRTVLKSLRHIFPYCTCSHLHKTICLNARIGRCLGYCCITAGPEAAKLSSRFPRSPQRGSLRVSPYARPANTGHRARFGLKTRYKENLAASYANNIRTIKKILSGKNKSILVSLKKEMCTHSYARRYEKAAKARNQIQALERIFAHRGVLKNDISSERIKALLQLATLLKIKTPISRIEGYDIANIHGKYAYGSMVVFIDGVPEKDEYRIFRIRGNVIWHSGIAANDPAMIHEIISRRLTHREWQLPDVMLIDGGKAQLNAAQAASHLFSRTNVMLAPIIVSLAKREEELYLSGNRAPIKLKTTSVSLYHLLTHIRNEAHRFAIKYYRAAHQKVVGSRTSDNY